MKTSFINSVKDLENSKWVKAVRNPEVMNTLIPMATDWLNKHANHGELAQQATKALSILTGKLRSELLTPRNIIILAAGLLYAISPIDAVPDFIPFAGLADDLGVIVLVLKFILSSVDDISDEQKANDDTTGQTTN